MSLRTEAATHMAVLSTVLFPPVPCTSPAWTELPYMLSPLPLLQLEGISPPTADLHTHTSPSKGSLSSSAVAAAVLAVP